MQHKRQQPYIVHAVVDADVFVEAKSRTKIEDFLMFPVSFNRKYLPISRAYNTAYREPSSLAVALCVPENNAVMNRP